MALAGHPALSLVRLWAHHQTPAGHLDTQRTRQHTSSMHPCVQRKMAGSADCLVCSGQRAREEQHVLLITNSRNRWPTFCDAILSQGTAYQPGGQLRLCCWLQTFVDSDGTAEHTHQLQPCMLPLFVLYSSRHACRAEATTIPCRPITCCAASSNCITGCVSQKAYFCLASFLPLALDAMLSLSSTLARLLSCLSCWLLAAAVPELEASPGVAFLSLLGFSLLELGGSDMLCCGKEAVKAMTDGCADDFYFWCHEVCGQGQLHDPEFAA